MSSVDIPTARLSDRELDILRLLSKSHDAKSIAAELGLSVHTVNEYLRSARRKLGVSSSREAARRLAAQEASQSNNAVDGQIGVAANADDGHRGSHVEPRFTGRHLAFAIGGTFAMSLGIAAALFAWFAGSAVTGPLSNWSTASSAPPSGTVVKNRIHLEGRQLVWNGTPITEQQARDYLGITKQMSPQPLLVFSTSSTASEGDKQWARALIDGALQCTPKFCLEIVDPAT